VAALKVSPNTTIALLSWSPADVINRESGRGIRRSPYDLRALWVVHFDHLPVIEEV
jgi:hypothetical protein